MHSIYKKLKERRFLCSFNKPNLRTVKTVVNGQPKKIKVCAKCLRAGKVKKA